MNYVVLSEKVWNKDIVSKLSQEFKDCKFFLINKKEDFTFEKLKKISPKQIFIPHWSYIIPKVIYERFECIVFHMTDLPYGRGGSPLQNLIIRNKSKTKISALRVVKELDAGDVYLKKELLLCGTAEEIFIRANDIIQEMIQEIIRKGLSPLPQKGEIVKFTRRKPENSNISDIKSIDEMFDYIRMLDAEGYPHAFFENDTFKFEFTRASLKADKTIVADVRIIKK